MQDPIALGLQEPVPLLEIADKHLASTGQPIGAAADATGGVLHAVDHAGQLCPHLLQLRLDRRTDVVHHALGHSLGALDHLKCPGRPL